MQKIPLTQAKEAIVDDRDFVWLNQWKWTATKSAHNWYAVRTDHDKRLYMHRIIAQPSNGQVVHHLDRNSLNNQRQNLEKCSQKENLKRRVFRK